MKKKKDSESTIKHSLAFIDLSFFSNPELQRAFFKLAIVAVVFISLTIIINLVNVGNTLLVTVVLLILCFASIMISTIKSYNDIYREIDLLSSYSRRILSNDAAYDIRDNNEGYISILKNDIYKLTVMLNESRKKEQDDKEYLALSIAEISHQLKTPLTSMQVMVELLKGGIPESKKQEFLLSIEKQLARLTWITSALLKISKLDSHTAGLIRKEVNVARLIQISLEPLEIIIELKKQNIFIKGNRETFFTGDINWSVEAITNILKNCVEHTHTGGRIDIEYQQTPLYTEIIIRDNGSGICKEDLPYVFKRFYKGKGSSSDSVGIGLAMSKAIIENQNGYISVNSHSSGTEFNIRFYSNTI